MAPLVKCYLESQINQSQCITSLDDQVKLPNFIIPLLDMIKNKNRGGKKTQKLTKPTRTWTRASGVRTAGTRPIRGWAASARRYTRGRSAGTEIPSTDSTSRCLDRTWWCKTLGQGTRVRRRLKPRPSRQPNGAERVGPTCPVSAGTVAKHCISTARWLPSETLTMMRRRSLLRLRRLRSVRFPLEPTTGCRYFGRDIYI